MWALGSWWITGSLCMDILCVPFIPFKFANPSTGILEVPVINWINLAKSYWEYSATIYQNHNIIGSVGE